MVTPLAVVKPREAALVAAAARAKQSRQGSSWLPLTSFSSQGQLEQQVQFSKDQSPARVPISALAFPCG